ATRLDADLALTLARLADTEGNIGLALRSYQKAHDIYFKLGDARGRSTALQGLGGIYDDARDFDREIRYYREALQVYPGEPGFELAIANNLGFALQQL